MDNQHKLIKGYRDLTAAEISSMNETKELASQVGALIDRLASMPDIDGRWIAIGKTHLQQGFMAVVRGIARPTSF